MALAWHPLLMQLRSPDGALVDLRIAGYQVSGLPMRSRWGCQLAPDTRQHHPGRWQDLGLWRSMPQNVGCPVL